MVPLACRVELPGGTPAPFIELTIPGRKCLALLDNGATVSLFGDEVHGHLERNSVRLRHRHVFFHLARGSTKSAGMVRLVTCWSDRCRRVRFVHLQGLTVPVILARNFLAMAGIVFDVFKGGYRGNSIGPLKPFASVPPVTTARVVSSGVECGPHNESLASTPALTGSTEFS